MKNEKTVVGIFIINLNWNISINKSIETQTYQLNFKIVKKCRNKIHSWKKRNIK